MVVITFTVVDTIVSNFMLIAGWSLANLETLICDSLTIQCGSQAGGLQESHRDGRASDEASALLPSAATTLAHMVETYFSMQHSTSVSQHRSQQRHQHSPAQSAAKLQTLLSLTAVVGSLSCSVSSEHGQHPPNLHVGKVADEQHEQGYGEASPGASERVSEAEARVQIPGAGESAPRQPAQKGEVPGSTESQQSSSFNDEQQMSCTSAKQCQEICLQVSLLGTAVCLIEIQFSRRLCTQTAYHLLVGYGNVS